MRNLILIVYVLALPLARATQDQFNVPQGYTLEALEPFGGKVARPNGWFFHVGAGPHAYSWEISKEDPSKGDWDTGLQIQLMVSIKELTKLSPKAFMQQLIDQKKAAVNVKKVLKECGETDLGFFHRRCLEVEEEATTAPPTRYHVLYSLFWSDQSDLAAFTLFSAPVSEWDKVVDIYNVMSTIEIIDPTKLTKTDTPAAPTDKPRPSPH